jgi:hypothetical protein
MIPEDEEYSSNKRHKSRRHRSRSALIEDESASFVQGNESRLRIDEDKERMSLNPGKSLKSSSKDLPHFYRSIYCCSTAYFVLAYSIVYLPGKIASAFLASLSLRGPVIFHHKILFRNIVGWEQSDAITIFAAPIVADFFQCIAYTTVFLALKRVSGYWRILGFWLMLHSFLRLTGCIIPGMVSGEEFGYLAGWMYWGSAILLVLFCFSILVMLGLSTLICKWAMEMAFSKHMVMKKKRQAYLFYCVGLPALSGMLLLGLFHGIEWAELSNGQFKLSDWQASVHEMTLLAQSLVMYGLMAASVPLYRGQEIINQRDLRMQRIDFLALGIAIMIPLGARIILGFGWYW